MAKDEPVIEVSGLQLSNNTFSASPPGSMVRAEECVMPQKGVVEPRRGQSYVDTLPTSVSLPFGMVEFDSHVLVNYGTSKTDTSYGLGYVDGSALSVYSGAPFNPVDDDGSNTAYGRMKFGLAGGFLFFCTTTGPKALEAYNGTPRNAGLLRMPDPLVHMGSASLLGAAGVGLPYGESRAYRTVLRRPLSDGRSLLSPPSGRFVVTNRILAPVGAMTRTGGNLVTVTIPSNPNVSIGLDVGDSFTPDPGEADFPATPEVVGTVISGNSFSYTDAGANTSNTVAQDLDTGPRPVIIIAYLPADATETTPVRLYRSFDTTSTAPSDELYLVAEQFPTGTDISNGYIAFIDTAPEASLVDPLYTNPQTGSAEPQPNDAPPLYRDTANWGERQWYLQTTGLQQITLQMLGVGAPDGVQDTDTIDIDGETFTFLNSPAAPGDVLIVSAGIPSVNIQGTTQNLITSINEVMEAAGKDIRAYYLGGQTTELGKILIQATSHEQAAFGVTASRPLTWTPALDSSTDVDSEAEYVPNGLSYAKLGQPEAVPLLNTTTAGARNFKGARILALKQALLVFKQGDGIYSVTGQAPFQVEQISTANILAPDAACVMADVAWAYTDQGILRISDSGGATVVSRPIETELQELLARFPEETQDFSFAIPYETERRVLFFVPFDFDVDGIGGEDVPVMRAWCYNNATQSWTGPLYRYVFGGTVSSTEDGFLDKRLYLGVWDASFGTTRITLERNGQVPEYKNYVDGSIVTSIAEVDEDSQGVTVVRLASAIGVENWDLLAQSSVTPIVLRPDLGPTWVQPLEDATWTVAACAVSKHYDATVQFQPQGAPSSRKTLTRLAWLFKPEWFQSPAAKTLLATDQCQGDAEIDTTFVGFGSHPFGEGPFGDPSPLVVDVNPLPGSHTNAAQYFPGFTMPVAWSKMKLQGFVLRLDTVDGPVGRGK